MKIKKNTTKIIKHNRSSHNFLKNVLLRNIHSYENGSWQPIVTAKTTYKFQDTFITINLFLNFILNFLKLLAFLFYTHIYSQEFWSSNRCSCKISFEFIDCYIFSGFLLTLLFNLIKCWIWSEIFCFFATQFSSNI